MNSRAAVTVLEENYLPTRAALLEIAAVLDRIGRVAKDSGAGGSEPFESGTDAAAKLDQLRQAIGLLTEDCPNRAEKIQRLFSRDYDPDWRNVLQLTDSPMAASTSQR